MSPDSSVLYKRSRFRTRLPIDRRYTAAHYWILEEKAGIWRVGFTQFATRMLGDVVESEFSVHAGDAIEVGQELGWLEGFKAVTSVYSVVAGQFLGVGESLLSDVTLVESDPYGAGWLYHVRGTPDPAAIDVNGYIAILDATIDKLLKQRHDAGESGDAS